MTSSMLSLNDVCFCKHIMQRMLFFTFEGFSWLEQQGSLCKLIIRTCVGCAVLGAIIHLGADREQRDGKRGEASEKSRQR